MKLNITALADRMIWFITLIFLVLSLTISFALGEANYGAYVLFVCLFGLIIFYLIREQGVIKLRFNWMHAYMLIFIGACYLSAINATDVSVAMSRSFDMVKIFFMLIILYMCYQDKKSVDTLLKIGMWTGYIVCFYTVYFYGLDYFITVLSSSARIANDALNANTVGLLGANAIVMTLYYMLYDRPRWWHIIALPTLGILAATGSRKALVFVGVGTVLLFIFKSFRSANAVNSIVKVIGSLLGLTIIGIAVLQLPMFSEVLDRMSNMAYMLLFIGACYLSAINATDVSVAMSRSFDMVKIFFMLIILYMCYQDKKSVDTLLKIGMWTGYIVCFYTVYFYGLDYFITVLSSSARIANDALNANTVGLLGANAIVMTLYYMLYDRPRWWHIIALPTLGILAATGSRKALVFVGVGTVLLFIFKSFRSANAVNSIVKVIGSLLGLTIIGIAVLQLPMFSEVLDRMSNMVEAFTGTGGDSSTIIRLALVDIGWDLFYQSPITGVGINNPSVYTFFVYGKDNYYLHNNYIELLAGTGVIGLLAYYSMYLYVAYNLIRYRDIHSNEYIMVLILFLSQIVMDMGMVSYESKSTYFYMMLFYLEVQLLRKGRKHEVQKIV